MQKNVDFFRSTNGSRKIEIIIIYDNKPFDEQLKTEWGFSCLIKGLEKTILFDTGGDGDVLINNMKKLNISPADIDGIFLSHEHWDHTGGLKKFFEHNHKVIVYSMPAFPEKMKSIIINAGVELVEITNPAYLCNKVATTGELGVGIEEQSLVLETEKGLVIITGCAHPGIVNIVQHVKENSGQDIYMALGGFHLGAVSDVELKLTIEQFRKFGVKKAGPGHCSGERCQKLFLGEYKADFVKIGVGKIIRIE